MDPTELGSGSASLETSHAVKQSGSFDVWASGAEVAKEDREKAEFLFPHVRNQPIKVCCYSLFTDYHVR